MTMIASTLPTSSLFDTTSFSSRPFPSRSTSNKLYSSSEQPSSASNFSHSIWQSKWPTFEKNSDHVLRDNTSSSQFQDNRLGNLAGSKRPQPPSLALTNIKSGSAQLFGPVVDRRSPIGSERGTTRESEPHSARSRSHFESTSLTPTSLTNESEVSLQNNPNLNQRRVKDPFSGAPSRELTSIWLNAPEFQPALPVQQQELMRNQNRELPKNAFDSAIKPQISANDEAFINAWYDDHDLTVERSEFRPLLSTGTYLEKTGDDFTFQSSDRGFRDLDNSFASLAIDREMRRPSYPRADVYGPSTSGSRYASYNVQDPQQTTQFTADSWSDRFYGYNKNSRADLRFMQPGVDVSRLAVTNGSNALTSQHNNMLVRSLQSTFPNNTSQLPSAHSRYEANEFRIADVQPYSGHSYNAAFYGPDNNTTTDYKDATYNFDPNLASSYRAYDTPVRAQTEVNQVTRSPLLEEFRVHGRTKKYELKDIFGHIVEFSGDQLGSRFIQHKLEVANSEEKDRVFNEIASDCKQLMTDLFGNYVIQKLFEHGNQAQKKLLAGHMKGHMMALSTQAYGCRVVQKALDHVLTDQQASLIKELDGYVLKVVDDQNGNHVIQKAIECIPGEHVQFIVDAHRGHVHALSKHAYGCRVIQRMLEHCKGRAKRAILDELHTNIGDLIQDPFGNYVVQHVIVNGESQDRRPVIDNVSSKLLENAMHKFASNVVEKALDYAEEDQRRLMLLKLTGKDEFGRSQIIKLLNHQFGNYVIQKSAAYLNGNALQTLLDEMEQYLNQLRRVSTGKQTSALEASVRDARTRLHAQQMHSKNYIDAPTEPNRYHPVARRQAL